MGSWARSGDETDIDMTPPDYAVLLRTFADTLDVDVDADPSEALPDPVALTRWLRRYRLLDGADQASAEDLDLAITLRVGLRAAMTSHHERDAAEHVPELAAAAADLPLQLAFDGTQPRLVPALGGVRGSLARLMIAIADAQAEGTWRRLKLCAADDCLLAFYDTSKNRSRQWCSMGECGNRRKTRAYRARLRQQREGF